MQLYNSLTASKGEFVVPTDRPVTLYVCGVTPYDTTHIGHARTFMTFDLLVRTLRWQGGDVRYCQNVTDVDDPLFERARRDGVDWRDLTENQVRQLVADCDGLNIIRPTFFPRASQEIDGMIPIIQRLVELGHAYEREGNVYFSVRSDPNFGAMARMGYDDLLATANQRGNNPNDPLKRDPLDFVLWQTGKPGDPSWESPWGMGRPGWHIECSAMATRYLGPQLDIHGGGRDLLFPHHPCEIAQTEPVTGVKPFAHVWMHAGLVWLDGEKMSKSLGNLVFARDALKEHGPNILRWYLLTTPYREEFFYERAEVSRTREPLGLVEGALAATSGSGTPLEVSRQRDAFAAALNDDLNTPLALAHILELSRAILAASDDARDISTAQATLREVTGVLGLQL
ncbi:MAG: cysteine--tRNA ligase [Chloroflexaceae bacterium]|jgi:L-cysteine:1D-myo-inositol 2-amino-2-deoxy-alpha-D-glucopyranoside ligase|nr:cysteine--tRNA ligase [Chloroflexaceae bacterium]